MNNYNKNKIKIDCLDIDGSKLKVSALKHSSTNDILKSYYQLTTFFRYPIDSQPLNQILFASVNNDFTILPRGSPCIIQVDTEEVKEESKSSGKSKKQPKQIPVVVKETNQDKMAKILAGFKVENKKINILNDIVNQKQQNVDEIGKGIALIKVPTIEVSIFSKIHQQNNQQTLTVSSSIQNQSKYHYVDSISYVKNDTPDHETEIQNHLQYFFEQIRSNENQSIYVYGLLDSPLCTQGFVNLDGNEPNIESKKILHQRNLLPSSFASFRFLDRLQNTKNIGLFKKEKVRNVHKFMPLKAGKNKIK